MIFNEQPEDSLFALVDHHFFTSPLQMSLTNEQLYEKAFKEMILFQYQSGPPEEIQVTFTVRQKGLESMGQLLDRNVPLRGTNMMVESHWSVIKRLYLLLYNRHCLDILFYVINVKLLQKFSNDFGQLCKEIEKPILAAIVLFKLAEGRKSRSKRNLQYQLG